MPFLICPQCLSKEPLTAAVCRGCGADLRRLPPAPEAPLEAAVAAFPEVELVDPGPGAWTPAAAPGAWEQDCLKPIPDERERCSLCEALDRILHKGAVIHGEVMISVAGIDLVYLGLQVVLASVDTARGFKLPGVGQLGPNLFDKGASR
ncbi:MAG: hypothetical protein COS90_10980 [Deltaproteobacteria bacterium CG07_land_8_20_14_0_80_60_11]|nr:MAG: hypothetical protein COS90_10980 [Deltaproteobacteria bacterium CG07_land_8_20_14_0_80_60_11]